MNTNIWYTHTFLPGTDWEREHDYHIQTANIILFLVSPDFIASHEHNNKEIQPAMARQRRKETHVIPIILRPVNWRETEFGHLLPLPDGGRPVTDPGWKTRDHAFFTISNGIKRVIIENGMYRPDSQQNNNNKESPSDPTLPQSGSYDALQQLENIIQSFTLLRNQMASFVHLRGPKNFSLEKCESQYNKLYGDTLVFLATYLPERISAVPEGFIETVHRQTREQLNGRDNISVSMVRFLIPYLEKLERISEQIGACVATLELYKREDLS